MKNKVIKIVFIVIALLIFLFVTNTYASGFIGQIEGNITPGMNSQPGKSAQNFGKSIIGVIQIAGVGIAVIMLLYIAIKYMMAAPSEKADFKKTAINFVIGAVIIFAATGILELIKKTMENLSGTLTK